MTDPTTPTTEAGRLLLDYFQDHLRGVHDRVDPFLPEQFAAIEAQARADERRRLAGLVEAALTNEDEVAHGEAVTERGDGTRLALGFCAYCDGEWPCRTQQGIDRLRAALLSDTEPAP